MKKNFITKENQDNTTFSPYKAPESEYTQTISANTSIPNYLVWAILSTISCFPPLGIVAIIFAIRSKRRIKIGDFKGAKQDSDCAKRWSIISATIFLLGIFLFFGFIIFVNALQITA